MEHIKFMMKRFKANTLVERLQGWLAKANEAIVEREQLKGAAELESDHREQGLCRFKYIMLQMRHGRLAQLLHDWSEKCQISLKAQAEEMQERLLRYQSQTEALDRFKMVMARQLRQGLTARVRYWHRGTMLHRDETRVHALLEVLSDPITCCL